MHDAETRRAYTAGIPLGRYGVPDEVAATVAALQARGVKSFGQVVDIADGPALQAFVKASAEALGGLDLLVSNASALVQGARPEDSKAMFEIDILGAVNALDAARPFLEASAQKTGDSAVVLISSISAAEATAPSAYGAMKAAVEHLTRSLALELSDAGVRVNAIAPDALRTPGDADLLVGDRDYGAGLALGWGDAVDVAGAAVFLASSASRFVTGTTIHVDGGSDAARGWRRTPQGWVP
jgi:3-oxoacyl-[acyl-carrier protein] reductase